MAEPYRKPFMSTCEKCGYIDDLRPYGPNSENICFSCAMKNAHVSYQRMQELLKGGQS